MPAKMILYVMLHHTSAFTGATEQLGDEEQHC